MKNLFLSFLAIATLASAMPNNAQACMDRNLRRIDSRALEELSRSASFKKCLNKLARKGVNMQDLDVYRKERDANDEGPISFTIKIVGESHDSRYHLSIQNNFVERRFVCGEPSDKFPKCL